MTRYTAVITTSALCEAAAGLLPARPKKVVRSQAHVYRVYSIAVRDSARDYKFIDPVDGAVLVECNYFVDEIAAHRWIEADIAFRIARPGGVH